MPLQFENATVVTTDGTTTITFKLPENQDGGDVVISSFTPPENTMVTISITGTDAGLFRWDEQNRLIYRGTAQDYEANPDDFSVTMEFYLIDETDYSYDIENYNVVVEVADVNERPIATDASGTAVTGYSFAVDENAGDTDIIGTVYASDPEGDAITFDLAEADKTLFEIDATTGAISLAAGQSLDHETLTEHQLTLQIAGANSVDTTAVTIPITITVNDVDELPVFTSATTISVAENGEDGAVVYTVQATSKAGDILAYGLEGTDASFFDIDDNGVVTLLAGADFETKSSYEFIVTAENIDGTSRQTVTLSVTNVNEPPIALGANDNQVTSYSFDVDEDAGDTDIIGTVRASDPEESAVRYTLASADRALFEIHSITGQLSLVADQSLDHETATEHRLTLIIITLSPGSTAVTIPIIVTVNDVTEPAPVFTSGTTASVAENGADGQVIYTATATSTAGAVSYGLEGTDADDFSISTRTNADTGMQEGIVTLDSGANFEAKSSYEFVVTATNQHGTSRQTVTLSVTDVNEPPRAVDENGNQVSSYSFDVDEDASSDYVIGTVRADDPEGDAITYRLAQTIHPFEIDSQSGEISLTAGQSLDYETLTEHDLSVVINGMDANGNVIIKIPVTITVNDVDETPSDMALSVTTLNLHEGYQAARKVADITFTDDVRGINSGHIPGVDKYFEIRRGTELWLKNNFYLDHEADSFHSVEIYSGSTGIGSQPESETFTLNITDIDISMSSLPDKRYHNSIAAGAQVADINATVTGSSNGARYLLSGDDASLFRINSSTGVITARNTINPTETTEYDLTVTAYARSGDSSEQVRQSFTIEVNTLDISPALLTVRYRNSITEDLPTDPDGDRLTYRITDRPDHGGTVTLNATAGTFTFTAAHRTYWGPDSFTIRVTDVHGLSKDWTVDVNIEPIPWTGHTLRLGTIGDDTLTGENSVRDIFFGGPGDDTMSGGTGADGYVIDPNSGNDTIIDAYSGLTGWWAGITTIVYAKNKMKFVDINANQIHLDIVDGDLVIGITDSGAATYGEVPMDNRVTIQSWRGQFDEFYIGDSITHSTANFLRLFDKDYGWSGGSWDHRPPPIILDMDNDGLEFIDSLSVSFDWNEDGTPDRSSWVGPADGLLVYDANSDNQVTASEITFARHVEGAQSDLEGLVAFDANQDGWLNADDPAFSKFKVWRDADSDGTVDDGELKTLTDSAIAGLRLTPTPDSGKEFNHINLIATSVYEHANGSEYLLGDIVFTFLPGEDIL